MNKTLISTVYDCYKKEENMHIVVTNDDGIVAPGLMALAEEMKQIGRVSIMAPDRNWSASGHVRTLDRPLRVREVVLSEHTKGWACDGAPSDCVALALCGFFNEPVGQTGRSTWETILLGDRRPANGSCRSRK